VLTQFRGSGASVTISTPAEWYRLPVGLPRLAFKTGKARGSAP